MPKINVHGWHHRPNQGSVHKVRYAIFGQFLPPPPVTFRHTYRDPPKVRHTTRTRPPISRRPSTKKPDKSPLVQILFQLSTGVFVPGVLSEGLLSGRFCPGWFLSVHVLSEYICYIRKFNITLNFMFRMYDKKFISVTSHALCPLPCHKLSHFGPPPLERDVL